MIGFVERNSTFEETDWQRIKKSVEKSPTTLRRFLVSKAGRKALGFVEKNDNDGPAFKRDPGYIINLLSHLFSDIDAARLTHEPTIRPRIEPYAGGAAVAFELLLTGVVRRVAINDLNRPISPSGQCRTPAASGAGPYAADSS